MELNYRIMDRNNQEILKSLEIELGQLNLFLEDLKILINEINNDKYNTVLEELNQDTDRLRANYSILYSQILIDHPELKELVQN